MQVLLSQVHRLRALVLLGRFLDMGRWAVDLALSVGIFPYVLKLLQTTAPDLRQTLVFIWTKILALDRSCQVQLIACNGRAVLWVWLRIGMYVLVEGHSLLCLQHVSHARVLVMAAAYHALVMKPGVTCLASSIDLMSLIWSSTSSLFGSRKCL